MQRRTRNRRGTKTIRVGDFEQARRDPTHSPACAASLLQVLWPEPVGVVARLSPHDTAELGFLSRNLRNRTGAWCSSVTHRRTVRRVAAVPIT